MSYSVAIPRAQGYGFVTAIIGAATTVTSLIYQDRMQARQIKRERHERERAQAREAEDRARAQAAAKAAAEAAAIQAEITKNATGGAVAVDAHGRPLPASGVAAALRLPGGISPTMILVGVGGIGLLWLLVGRK